MNLKTLIVIVGLLGFSGISIYYGWNKNKEKETTIIRAVKTFLNRLHFDPQTIDDDYSAVVFTEYLERLDAGRRLFTKEDLVSFAPYKYQLDNEYKDATFNFFDFSVGQVEEKITRAKGIFEEVISMDFDFTTQESLIIDVEQRPFAEDETQLKDNWRKYIKYDMLNRIENMKNRQKKKREYLENPKEYYASDDEGVAELDTTAWEKDKQFVKLPLDSLILRARKNTKKSFMRWFDRMEDMRRVDWMSTYLNSFTTVFDPHTSYFKPKDKEDFDMRMSNRLEGIGARLSPDGELVKVAGIVPGGPAWEGKELQEDDLILKVAQDGEDPKDIMGMHLDDVVSLIRGPKGSKVILTVKHVDGEIEEVVIIRDVIEFEENYAKSAVLIDSISSERYGYIYLPSFYADFDDKNARSSSGDIKAELAKINVERLEGLILDLRNNGGGSLRDVIDIAGLFIEEGPVVQVKSRDKDPYVLEDDDSEVDYRGAVVVLVNHFSASASEILAAALQDYDRAIIVGASSTFGKGTVQRFYDLDRALRGSNDMKPLGSLKLTTQKYYRINGGSVQLRGVVPDIVLPDRYNYVDVGEKDYPFAMEWTQIKPASYEQQVFEMGDKEYLATRSKMRTDRHESFQLIEESAKLMKKLKAESAIELTFEGYETYKKERDDLNDRFDELDEKIPLFGAELLAADVDYVAADSTRMDSYTKFLDGITEDIYIKEAMSILQDIELSKNVSLKAE